LATVTQTRAKRESSEWEQVDLYRFFAFIFGSASTERFAWFRRPNFRPSLSRLWQDAGCRGKFPGVSPFRNYAQYEATYISLFDVGVPAPPVPLLESAHHKTVLAQQIALENISFYDVLGLRADPAGYPPDHLVTQLEFLSAVRFAGESATDAQNAESLARLERDFLERHLLNWVPAAQKKLEDLNPPVFPVLMTLLLAFLKRRHKSTL